MEYEVAHNIPGRLRLRIPALVNNQDYGAWLRHGLASLAIFESVRVNPAAGSLVLTYAEEKFTPEFVLSLVVVGDWGGDWHWEPAETTDPFDRPQTTDWQHLLLPGLSVTLALVATVAEVPSLVLGIVIAGAAQPWIARALESTFVRGSPSIDVLDSLWMGLHTLQGQYLAPAFKTALAGGRRNLRAETSHERYRAWQNLPSSPRRQLALTLLTREPVYDTQLGTWQAQLSHSAVLPTLALSGTIFILTGNLGRSLAPLQLDFGSGIQTSMAGILLNALLEGVEAGIYIPSGRSLEMLARLDTLVLAEPTTPGELAALGDLGVRCLSTVTPPLEHNLLEHGHHLALVGYIHADPHAESPMTILRLHSDTQDGLPEAVTLLEPGLMSLVKGITLARRALGRIESNAALIWLPNLVVVCGGIFWGWHPLIAVLTNNCTAFLVETGQPAPSIPEST